MSHVSSALKLAKKSPIPINKVVSLSSFRYGHDPSHYPIKALKFVASHPKLWRRIFCVACAGILLALVCLILLLALALKPQAMAFGGGQWWSWLLAVLAVLLEAGLAAALLMSVAQSKCQTDLFVMTMEAKGEWREGLMRKQSIIKDFQILKKNFFVRVITYPLNLIPIAGSALYSAINATFIGWDYMDRYFDAIKISSKLQRIEVLGEDKSDCAALCSGSTYDDNNDYARFGFVVAFLEAIPIVGTVLFPLTNAVAAALFACDIEAAGGPTVLSMSQTSEDEALASDAPSSLPK